MYLRLRISKTVFLKTKIKVIILNITNKDTSLFWSCVYVSCLSNHNMAPALCPLTARSPGMAQFPTHCNTKQSAQVSLKILQSRI